MEDDRGVHAGTAIGVRFSTARSGGQEEGRGTPIYHIVCYPGRTNPGSQFIARHFLGIIFCMALYFVGARLEIMAVTATPFTGTSF